MKAFTLGEIAERIEYERKEFDKRWRETNSGLWSGVIGRSKQLENSSVRWDEKLKVDKYSNGGEYIKYLEELLK